MPSGPASTSHLKPNALNLLDGIIGPSYPTITAMLGYACAPMLLLLSSLVLLYHQDEAVLEARRDKIMFFAGSMGLVPKVGSGSGSMCTHVVCNLDGKRGGKL